MIQFGIELPTREKLGIALKGAGYYPTALEYGYKRKDGRHIPARSYIRSTINKMQRKEIATIGSAIRRGITLRGQKLKVKRF